MAQMESVRLKIHGHMMSVGEEMLFVLEKYTSDVCSVKLDVRVFVLERLSEVAEFLCNLFQKEMETLHNTKLYNADFLHVLVCKEEVSLVQEEPQPPQIKEEQEEVKEEQEELFQRPEEADDTQSHLDSSESPLTHSPLPPPMVNSADADFALLSSSLSSTSPCSLPPSSPGLGAPPGDLATVASLPDTPSPTPSPSSGESEEEKAKKLLYCSLCKVAVNSLSQLEAHNKDHHRERSIESRETASRRYSTFSEEQREMDQGCGLLDARLKPVVKLYRLNVHNLPVGDDQVSPEQQEQPEPPQNEEEHEEVLQRPEENEGLTLLTLPTVESEDDDENGETEPVAATSSTEHMKTQADVQDRGTSQPTSDEHLSSAESEDEDWKPALNTLKSQKTKHVKGQRSLSNKLSKDQKSLKQTDSVTSSKGCSQKRSRKRPVKTRTRGTPLTCEVCGKLQSSISNLNTHMRIHTGEKPYTCTVCCKAFRTLNNFQLHMRNHTGEKPFTCATCGKSFSHQSHLKKHLYVHTGEKPYTCEVCHEAYSHLWYLKYHMRTHTGDKPFTCSVCCKDFSQSHHLKDHMRLHTGEKPFACLVCGHKFNHKNHLKLHMRIHTGEKPFTCTLCARQFARNDKLRNHLRTHKGEKNKTPEDS